MQEHYIPVLTTKRRPLAPCHPERAKSLVTAGKASFKHRRGIRCIILHKSNVPKLRNTAKLQLRVNPGSATTGIAVTRDDTDGSRQALMTLEIHHRGKDIHSRMVKRRKHRQGRRYRKTRHRQPRFNNRTRQPDWLPPSILSRYRNTLTWVRRLSRLLPINGIHIETQVFDPQLLRNPEIRGIEYQQGPLYQTNLRTAVLERDGRKCVYCGKSAKRNRLELDHVVPKANGGTDRYDNLVAACIPCNRKKANQTLEAFLRRRPAKLAQIQEKLGMELAAAAHMNIIIPRLLEELTADGWRVTEHSAASTAAGRITCHAEKYHHVDAALLGCPSALSYMPSTPITIQATGRGAYQRIMTDKFGTPRGHDYRDYCKLPKHIRRMTATPSHKKRQKRVDGIATGDYVTFHHRNSQAQVHGYAVISNRQAAITRPQWKSTKAIMAVALERNHGYQVEYPSPHRQREQDHSPQQI